MAGSDGDAEIDVESPTQHLWTLLMGKTILASEEVVHEELKRNCNKIITGLQIFDRLSAEDIEKYLKKFQESTNVTSKDKLCQALVKKLKLSEKCAWSLFLSYIMFEYKGSLVSYDKLVESDKELNTFMDALENFYLDERLCLIYCSQLILKYSVEENHPYTDIFSAFAKAACVEEWVKWMTLSLQETLNEKEKIELLHTLSSILYYMGRCENAIKSAVENLESYKWSDNSKDLLQAEAILCYALLQAGEISSANDNEQVEKFLETHVSKILQNPFTTGSVLKCFKLRCPDNKIVRSKLQEIHHPTQVVHFVVQLLGEYALDGHKNKHGISSVVLPCVNEAVQFVLANYAKENFGTTEEWHDLVQLLLKDPQIANDFIHDGSEDLIQLYHETLMVFPVEINAVLKIWKSIFSALSSSEFASADSLVLMLENLVWVAEIFDSVEPRYLKPNGNNEWILLRDRIVYGIPIRAQSVGVTVDDSMPLVICWDLTRGNKDAKVWDILMTQVIQPSLVAFESGDSYFLEQNEEKLCNLAEFLIILARSSKQMSYKILNLFKPLSFLLQKIASEKTQPAEKVNAVGLCLKLISVGGKFDRTLLLSEMAEFWPISNDPNVVERLIIGYESVTSSKYLVTKAFLEALIYLMEVPIHDGEDVIQQICISSIWFVLENIFPSYEHWTFATISDRNEIMNTCLTIFLNLYRSNNPGYSKLKEVCNKEIMEKRSSLFAILKIDETLLRDSIIRPTGDTLLIPEIMTGALNLLMELHLFKKDVLKLVDSSMGLNLIQKLGRLCRHRLIPLVPTLAIKFLKNIAGELTISVLACLHTDAVSFRDLILQRLEYRSEDINLKVGILEFLGVCAHTQLGLVQHFFEEANFVERLIDLFSEREENLSVAVLGFIRALFRRGASTIKNYPGNIWSNIFDPIKQMRSGSKLEVVTRTINIATFEMYINGASDQNFSTEVSQFLKCDEFERVIKICFETAESDKVKALVAIKQFFVILTSRPDLAILLPQDTKRMLTFLLLDKILSEDEINSDGNCSSTMAELLLHLSPWDDETFFKTFIENISHSFEVNVIAVQKPLLALMINCIKRSKTAINSITINHIVSIVSRIFYKAAQVYESNTPEIVYPILALSANIVTSIINSSKCQDWTPTFHYHFLIMAVVNVASVGILKGKGPEIVAECLGVLIQLCSQKTCDLLAYTSFSKYLWLPLVKFATPDLRDPKWNDVYLLGVSLNTKMIHNHKFHYLEESLNFWGLHGLFLAHKLWDLSDVVDRFFLKNPEKNFREMKELLGIVVFTLDAVSAMVPFIQQWRLQQPYALTQTLEGVFTTLRTSAALLSQPNHLLFLISSTKMPTSLETRLTPSVLEIQTKLWEVMGLVINIFWNLRNQSYELDFAEPGIFMTTIYSVVDLCVKGLTKGDKKTSLNVNIKNVVLITLEKSLGVIFFRGKEFLKMIQENPKDEKSLKRELEAETIAVCDNVKRLGLTNNDFINKICFALEEMFR